MQRRRQQRGKDRIEEEEEGVFDSAEEETAEPVSQLLESEDIAPEVVEEAAAWDDPMLEVGPQPEGRRGDRALTLPRLILLFNSMVGFNGWWQDIVWAGVTHSEKATGGGWRVMGFARCRVSLRNGIHALRSKQREATLPDRTEATNTAVKSAVSAALRACMRDILRS